jgi:hypothetical protein
MARVLLIAVAGVLLCAGIYSATLRGLADAEYTQARLLVGLAAPGAPAPRAERVSGALAHLGEALRLEPDNPHFVEQFARMHELQAIALAAGDPAARQALRQSAAAFRLAARIRPGSPYVWADLARVKLRLDDMDFEFYGALERAARLGPWEPAVQLAIVDIGLAAWSLLAAPARDWVVGALDRALLRDGAEVRRITTAHGGLTSACALAQLPPRLAAWCVKK